MKVISSIIYHYLSIISNLGFHHSFKYYYFLSYVYMRVYTSVYLNYKFSGFSQISSLKMSWMTQLITKGRPGRDVLVECLTRLINPSSICNDAPTTIAIINIWPPYVVIVFSCLAIVSTSSSPLQSF